MRGRPTDPSKIKKSQTRSKAPKAAEARRTGKALAAAAAAAGPVVKDGKGKRLVGSRRTDSPFLQAIRKLKSLTADEIRTVEASQQKGFGLQDAAAFWMYQFLQLEKAKAATGPDALDAKSYAIGLNQLLTAATKLAEVSARLTVGQIPSEIKVVFDLAKTLTGRALPGTDQSEPDEINGDCIVVG